MPKKKSKSKEQLPVENLHLKVKYLTDHFNFHRVHDAMVALDWKWQHYDEPVDQSVRVPTIERMKETATYLLLQAGRSKERYFATGGFHAQRFKDGSLQLQFVLAEYDTHDD